jgi:hypothetical protein
MGGLLFAPHRCYSNTYNRILLSTALVVHFRRWDIYGGHRKANYFLGSSRFLLIAIHEKGNAGKESFKGSDAWMSSCDQEMLNLDGRVDIHQLEAGITRTNN